jgi:hypothetical protein
MKKIFIMAVSAVLLAAGCQKTEIQNEAKTPIGFGTQMGKLTKAGPDAGYLGQFDNLNEQGFMVWGYFLAKDDLNFKPGDLYLGNGSTGIKVSASEGKKEDGTAAAAWTTTETYYWPGKGKELDIYAVSMYDADGENTYAKVTPSYENKTITVSNFKVNSHADNDLMVAPLITQDQDDSPFVEPFFTHALTKVLINFTTSATDVEVYVIGVETSPLAHTGTLLVDNTINKEDFEDKMTWDLNPETTDSPYVTYKDEYVGKSVVTGDIIDRPSQDDISAVKLVKGTTVNFASWLLLPQEDITNTYLNIEYIIDGMYVSQQFKLAVGDIQKWGKNMQTTYNVTIAPDFIEFQPEVQPWADANTINQNRGEHAEDSNQ